MNPHYQLPIEDADYNFGFLDEYAKREIRRAVIKAICIPGYQTPYASREMPMGRGFGTGGLQLTLTLMGANDCFKVIDQGSDDSVNAVNLRQFVQLTCPGVELTQDTQQATLIQTRHRIPEHRLSEAQILVLQVPYPDALVIVEASENKRKTMHGEGDYSRLLTKLYEDLVHYDEITISHRYPTRINDHYVIDPSPIPRYDLKALHHSPALMLFGAGREKKIYAVPPYTTAEPLVFDDVPFRSEDFTAANGQRLACVRCGSLESYLDELPQNDGTKQWQCSDTHYCNSQLAANAQPEVTSHE